MFLQILVSETSNRSASLSNIYIYTYIIPNIPKYVHLINCYNLTKVLSGGAGFGVYWRPIEVSSANGLFDFQTLARSPSALSKAGAHSHLFDVCFPLLAACVCPSLTTSISRKPNASNK